MSSLHSTYIPSPNWDTPADSDIVVLGRLIKDPKDPESKVPKSSADPIPPPQIYKGEKTDWETTLEQVRSGHIGLWAKCLQSIGGQLSLSETKSSIEEHKFEYLETKYFLPDDDYLALALEDIGVRAYLQVHNWRKPVFLITGVKIARGARVSTESSSERSADVEVKANAESVGMPNEVGPKAGWESKKKKGVLYDGSTDYIFAYQLLRMMPKKGGKKVLNESYVKGAVFGKEEGDNVEVKVRNIFDIEEEVSLGFLDT
ncbi:hypothetical protein F4679DRAFT_110541 [Xylaria curta]|nr:hypothetical protein F4679DRAFT_110541 [Xylaria curta]